MTDFELWRPALIAFYERDDRAYKAKLLRQGQALDFNDKATIKALEAAFIYAAVAA